MFSNYVFTVKFYPDISASDQAIQIAIARNFRKWRKRKRFFSPSRPRLLPENKFCLDLIWVSRSVIDTEYVVINMHVYQKMFIEITCVKYLETNNAGLPI